MIRMKAGRLIAYILLQALLWVPASSMAYNEECRRPGAVKRQTAKLDRAAACIARAHMGDDDMQAIVEAAIRAMVRELDPHSSYITAAQAEALGDRMSGGMHGFGMSNVILRDTLTVAGIVRDSPAAGAGLRPGDRIVSVDGKSTVGLEIDEAMSLLGDSGNRVAFDVVRRGHPSPVRLRLRRSSVPLCSVEASYVTDSGVGYVRLSHFSAVTASEFADSLRALGSFSGLIVDLRGNGGGVMSEAVAAAGLFLPKGRTLLSVEGPGRSRREYRNRTDGPYRSVPLAVLVDEGSASASEIFAGAMQDWDRAVIIGRGSFGKGLVQRMFTLNDGSALLITIARYLTPSGRCIQRPYADGRGDEYFERHYERLLHPKSADTVAGPEYRTLIEKRPVFGGMGIVPDVEVVTDSLHATRRVAAILGSDAAALRLYDYLDANVEDLSARYGDFRSFERNYVPPAELLSGMAGAAGDKLSVDEKSALEVAVRAMVARRLFSSVEYRRILNSGYDADFEKAVGMLSGSH